MARNQFQWEHLPSRLIRAIARDLGLTASSAAPDFAKLYGTPPGEEFVRENWEVLRDEWLPDADDARRALVAKLWDLGVGVANEYPSGRLTEMAFLRTCNNARGLRKAVLEAIVGAEEKSSPHEIDDFEEPKQVSQPKVATLPSAVAKVSASSPPDLERWLWDAACSIRGAVDAPKFKDYILPLIFIKRLSDVFEDEIDSLGEKFGDRETALALADEDHTLVRFYIPAQASWAEVRKLTGNLGQSLTDIMRAVTKANPSLAGVIDIVDFNATVSGQRIIEDGRLSSLIEILSRHRLGLDDVEPDILGRAYEYLLRKFAEGQGQSAGEFFTPKEVGWLIARLLRPEEGLSVYDPACGSAGLLIKAELTVKESVETVKRPLQLYGQELNHVTYAIAKMNMIIHDMEGEVAIGDTFRNPKFLNGPRLKTFDLVAANPMWNQDGYDTDFYDADPFDRFKFGYAPASSADWSWVQHMFASLNADGRAVIVLDMGAVSRGSGGKGSNRERDIRRKFVDQDLVEGVILLPDNLFYNTGAPGVLLCINRAKQPDRRGRIILINAAREFEKGRPKNFIPDESIIKIATAFKAGDDIRNFLTTISIEEAAKNDYNISPSRYVEVDGEREVLSVEDAVVLLREAEEDRIAADSGFDAAMEMLGLGGWRRE